MSTSLCDINILFALVHSKHPQFNAAAAWAAGLAEGEAAICRHVQLGLLRLLCNRSVMGVDVLSNEDAWALWLDLMADDAFVFVSEPHPTLEKLPEFGGVATPNPNRWSDAYLAAFAVAADLEFVTFDKDFRGFHGLRLRLLAASAPSSKWGGGYCAMGAASKTG